MPQLDHLRFPGRCPSFLRRYDALGCNGSDNTHAVPSPLFVCAEIYTDRRNTRLPIPYCSGKENQNDYTPAIMPNGFGTGKAAIHRQMGAASASHHMYARLFQKAEELMQEVLYDQASISSRGGINCGIKMFAENALFWDCAQLLG